jgi:hypothetical protein
MTGQQICSCGTPSGVVIMNGDNQRCRDCGKDKA